jgi:phosphatidylserine decarboxylase
MVEPIQHCYVDRITGSICCEELIGDRWIQMLYSHMRERAPLFFHLLTSSRSSALISFLNYDLPLIGRFDGLRRFIESSNIDLSECLNPESFRTLREIFERKICYWVCRPMTNDSAVIVSPADARMLVGSFDQSSSLFLKEKFFHFDELLGHTKRNWLKAFEGGAWAIFRLTPDKYHYNHTPVAGVVVDFYQIDGPNHSCNPHAVVTLATSFSKNARTVTIIDTDVDGGTHAGLVAMIEITALMIGEVVQCYSHYQYDSPHRIRSGMFMQRGCPKSLYRPGSSTDVLIFQPNKVQFDSDLVMNMNRVDCSSRFSDGFGKPLAETQVRVRTNIGTAMHRS